MRRTLRLLLLASVAVTAACGGDGTGPSAPTPKPLEPLRTLIARRNLPLGVGSAVSALFNSTDDVGRTYMAVLAREFNVLTPENDMKFEPLRPSRDVFRFARPDSMVAFAAANGMRVRGHALVWHQQLPAWLTSGTWTRDEAIVLLEEHVDTVVAHYRGKLAAWDVVNEAFADGAAPLRSGFWADHIGREYIERAFQAARAADPAAALYYNDYGIEGMNAKSDSVLALLQDFRARGVPVDGVGMQMHLVAGALPAVSEMRANFARFAALGLRIHITELDIRVRTPSTQAALETQAQDYRTVFSLCLETPACEMVVMWGFTDRDSWVPYFFAGWGDALLFDSAFQPKPAYRAVNALLAGS